MVYKKWILKYLILSFIFCTSAISLNYYLDSYAIFTNEYSKLLREPNQNFIKMEFLINKNHSFDSYIFGSSRVGHISPIGIQNGNYYNMTYSEGIPEQHLSNIKLLIKKSVKIKNVLIGLDDFSYEIDPLRHKQELMRLSHYETDTNAMTKIDFYTHYLFKIPSAFDMLFIKKVVFNEYYSTKNYDIYKTGLPVVPKRVEDYIENNLEKHTNDIKFMKPSHYEGNRIKETINSLKEIIILSKKYNFKLKIFINPIHSVTYLDTNFNNFQIFKKELAKITDYYDFSGLNRITTNNYYYYETSHYRDMTGELIKKRLFNSEYEKYFGVYVSKNNIDKHLKNMKEQIKNYDSDEEIVE